MADMLKFESKTGNSETMTDNKQSTPRRRYSSDEVADIIRISLLDEPGKNEDAIDHSDLLSIGKEFGVSDSQIDRAIGLLEDERRAKDKEHHLWAKFKLHCATSIAVMALCVFINLLTGMTVFWSGYVILGMGLFLLGHYAGIRYMPEFVELTFARTLNLAKNYSDTEVDDDDNVSFTVGDDSGLMESNGLLCIEDEVLQVEYQSQDSILGLFQSSVKNADIDVSEIRSARLERKMLGTDLVLKGNSLKTFNRLPGNVSGTLRLRLDRSSLYAAQNIVDDIVAINSKKSNG